MNKIKAGIIGATGYAGAELVRLLLRHPNVELRAISSISFENQEMQDIYPNFRNICNLVLGNQDEVINSCDIIFASLPHGFSEKIAQKCFDNGKCMIDLGADFRLHDPEDYHEWYGLEYENPSQHAHSAYIIPELHRGRARGKKIIANPGCYPTSIALGLAPILKAGYADVDSIVIDSKSGVTGAGRGLSLNTHYPECNESFSPYKIASHRHTPEIEQTLSEIAETTCTVTFVPHLLPINRGIVSTIYVKLNQIKDEKCIYELYEHFYTDEEFVRILPLGQASNLKHVKYSNYCDVSLHLDERTNRLITVSSLDNMVKGAAGQAVQNMNLLTGLPESQGLDMVPPAF